MLSIEILHGFYFAFVRQRREERDGHGVKDRGSVDNREMSNAFMHTFLHLKIQCVKKMNVHSF